jgi:transposase
LGFVLRRPKKRLLKASAEKRDAFVAAYAALRIEAQAVGAEVFFVDEAHFRADVEVRAKWVLRGKRALADSTSPRLGEKASYYSGICLGTGEVEFMAVTENSTAETSAAFLQQLRTKHSGPPIMIWDNGPAHRGPAMRAYLAMPDLDLRLVALPAYSPDFNADEAIWDWAREEVTANTCFGTAAKVRDHSASSDRHIGGDRQPVVSPDKPCRSHLGFSSQVRRSLLPFCHRGHRYGKPVCF